MEHNNVSTCICTNLRMAARAVSQAYDAALRPSDLKATQFTLLATLSQTGEIPLTQLAEIAVLDRTTLTRNLQPLIRRGLVQADNTEDQRVRLISLTGKGERIFREAYVHWEKIQTRMLEQLGNERWPELAKDLQTTIAAAQAS